MISIKKLKEKILHAGLIMLCLLVTISLNIKIAFASEEDNLYSMDKGSGADPEIVRVGYYENEVFQEGAKEGAVKTGYAYEYYLKLSEYTGWRYEYVYGDFGELYQKLLDGEIDMLAGLAKTDERTQIIGYPDAPMGNEVYSLVKHESDEDVTAITSTFSGRRIGILDSAMVNVLKKFLKEQNVKANIVTFSDYEKLFEAFDMYQVDLLAAEGDGAYGRAHSEVLCSFGSSDYYLCVNIREKELLRELNKAQGELDTNEPNYISSLRSKYYPVTVSSRIFSAPEKEWLENHKSLRIGYLKNYLPYSDSDSNGEVTGLLKDIIPKIMGDLDIRNIEVSYQGFESYDDMVAAVTNGTVDTIFPVGGGLYYSEENGIYQSNSVASSSTELVFKGDYSDDTVLHFAVNENNRMQYYYIKTNFPNAEISYYPSIEACLNAVLDGEVGCTTLNGLRANEIMKNRPYSNLFLRQLNHADDRAFGVQIGNEGLLKFLNRGISVIGTDYIQNQANRYMGGLYSYTLYDFLREHMLVIIFVLLIIIACIIIRFLQDARKTKKNLLEKENARKALEDKNRELADSEEALSQALLSAEEASRAKSDFLSNMSHEIRTPITAILGMNEMIQRESDNSNVLDYAETIQKASESLLGIISDILDFSKIESGHMELIKENYTLSGLIDDCLNLTRLRAESKGLDLQVEVDSTLPEHLIGDEIRVKQIITNLLSNAVKYTEKGFVRLECVYIGRDGDAVILRVAVKDSGMGIKAEEMDRLFSAFERLDATRTRTIEGTGLGLAITNKLLSMMESELHVESEYGKGSTFSFTLRQEVSDWTPIGVHDTNASDKEGSRKKGRTPFIAPKARILIVDDVPMNLKVIKSLLKRTEMHIDTADSGENCLEVFEKEDYDLVFLDYRMPGMDGIETLGKLRELFPEKAEKTPIVSLTASAVAGNRERMLKASFTDFLTKPVDIGEMEALLIKYLPPEKVISFEAETDDEESELKLLPPELFEIKAIEPILGVRFCGGAEEYMDALEIFKGSIDSKSMDIEFGVKKRDFKSYTLTVHSIKSTLLSIGAVSISDMAKALEAAGDKEDIETIERDTPKLLEQYRSLKEPLEKLFMKKNNSIGADKTPQSGGAAPLSEEEFQDAVSAMKDFSETFDYDSLMMVMEDLEQAEIPAVHADMYKELKSAVDKIDWDKIKETLNSVVKG